VVKLVEKAKIKVRNWLDGWSLGVREIKDPSANFHLEVTRKDPATFRAMGGVPRPS
jgi:hypothetical protein